MNYYELSQYISNSDLKDLRQNLYGRERPTNLQDIFDFGNLVDGMITEQHRIDDQTYSLKGDNGKDIIFETTDFAKAQLMKQCFDEHPEIKKMFVGMKSQYVFARKTFQICYQEHIINIKARCKFDGYSKQLGVDIKTTAAKDHKSFVQSIQHFDYDQGAAWYMDLAGIDRFLIIGISKHVNRRSQKHDIFLYAIERDSDDYRRGLWKYSYWAFKYHLLIQPFFDPTINEFIRVKTTNDGSEQNNLKELRTVPF